VSHDTVCIAQWSLLGTSATYHMFTAACLQPRSMHPCNNANLALRVHTRICRHYVHANQLYVTPSNASCSAQVACLPVLTTLMLAGKCKRAHTHWVGGTLVLFPLVDSYMTAICPSLKSLQVGSSSSVPLPHITHQNNIHINKHSCNSNPAHSKPSRPLLQCTTCPHREGVRSGKHIEHTTSMQGLNATPSAFRLHPVL